MTNLYEHAEPCLPLDRRARAIVEASAARDTFRALLGIDLPTMSVGWPVFTPGAQLHAPEVMIELTSGTTTTFELAVWISNESAARWVDRALGGSGESGLASAAGKLSEAECGVLAYFASRVCRHFDPFQVRDVRPHSEPQDCVRWPIAIDSALGRLTMSCVLAPWRAEALRDRHLLTVSVFDRAPETFRAGDVWISDRWNLSSTSEGLAGEVQLSVPGCVTQLSGLIGAGSLHAGAPSSARDALEVVLAEQPVRFLELAQIAAGQRLPFALAEDVELRSAGETLARGELISWRGAVGVRINEA